MSSGEKGFGTEAFPILPYGGWEYERKKNMDDVHTAMGDSLRETRGCTDRHLVNIDIYTHCITQLC